MEYEFLEGKPFWFVVAFLYMVALLRTQAIYWIGRGVGGGLHRTRLATRAGDRLGRAERLINRFGPPVVTVSYLTIGLQTAIHATAGAMRMSFARYLVAMLPGCALWAALYSLGGMAVLGAWWDVFVHSPPLAIGSVVLLAVVVAATVALRRRRRARWAHAPARERSPAP